MDNLLIILTADDCGPCKMFKSTQLESLKNKTKSIKNLVTIHINLPTRASQIEDKYHPQFRSLNPKWFPSFYLFNEKEFYTFNKPLKGYILNGTIDHTKNQQTMGNPQNPKYRHTSDDIVRWINDIYKEGNLDEESVSNNRRKHHNNFRKSLFSNNYEAFNVI